MNNSFLCRDSMAFFSCHSSYRASLLFYTYDTIRYDTIEEINVDSKAEYTA